MCADVDSLLHELAEMKLDLPASRGTDQHARKLGALGALGVAERRPSGIERRALVAEAVPAAAGFGASSRPTTAQMIEELERRGLEDGVESPMRLGCTASPQRLEEAILREEGTPAGPSARSGHALARDAVPDAPPVLNAVRENSVDNLLQDLVDMDEEHGEFAQQAQLCSVAPRQVVPAAPQSEPSVAYHPPKQKSSSCAVM